MKKKFITNLFFLLALNFLIKPFYILGIDAEIINRVGAESYGAYFSLFNFAFLFTIFLDLGINSYNTKNIAQNESLLSKYFSRLFSLKLFLVMVYLLFTLLAGLVWGYSKQAIQLLLLLCFNQGLVALVMYLRSNLSAVQLFVKDSIISVLDRFLMILICSVLLWGNITEEPFKIEWFVYAQTVSYAISLVLALFWVWQKASFINFRFNNLFSVAIIKQSLPYALLILLMTFYYKSDTIMLEKMLEDGSRQVGYYAQAYRFFEAGNMVAYLFSVLLLPIFSKMIKENENLESLVGMSFKIMFSSALIVSVLCFQFGDNILEWRYNDLSEQSNILFSVLMFCFLCISTTYIFGTLLTANNDLRFLNVLAGTAVLINIGLNLVFIPKWQALGSAMASLITQLFVSLIQVLVSYKKFKFKQSVVGLLRAASFVIGVFTVAYFVHLYVLNWTLAILVFVVLSFLFAFSIRMIPLKQMLLIIKTE